MTEYSPAKTGEVPQFLKIRKTYVQDNKHHSLFSHGTHHSKSVCILLDPTINSNVEYFFSNNTGRIVLITTCLNGVKTSLCNIYAPNSQSDQLEFIQELNNCIVDKSEMTNIIIGGDWTCALTKKDKKGGAFWKPTPFRNLLLTHHGNF